MHSTQTLSAALVAGLLLAGAMPAFAQQNAVDTAQSVNTTQQLQKPLVEKRSGSETAPLLYQDEIDDVGPQYVLQPKMKPKYFQAMSDFQLYRSSNVALAPGNKVAVDVAVLTLQLAAQSEEKEIWNKLMAQAHGGFRFQSYWYGAFSDNRDRLVSGPTLAKYNDFKTYSPYLEATFRRDNWYGSAGMRYAAFTNDTAVSQETFYQEWVPSWSFGYQYNINANNIIQTQYDGDYRGTNTDEKGLHPTGWEDRADHSLSITYSHILGEHWVIQPSYRFMWSDYTATGRNRSDVYDTLSLVVAYYFNAWSSARFFTSYDWRDSSEPFSNYENWNIGVGASVNFSF